MRCDGNLTETEIHEFAAQAFKELQRAEDALSDARDRADAFVCLRVNSTMSRL